MAGHHCFACDTGIVGRGTVQFTDRFVGPVGRAHGGISIGALACIVQQQAEREGLGVPAVKRVSGRLHRPVSLDTPLDPEVVGAKGEYQLSLVDDYGPCVTGTAVLGRIEPDTLPGHLASELESLASWSDADLDGPTLLEQYNRRCEELGFHEDPIVCFGCSELPGALKLYYRATPERDVWTTWTLEPAFTDSQGHVSPAVAVAALDCSNLWVVNAQYDDVSVYTKAAEGKTWFTGTHTVHFLRELPAGIDYRIMARFLGREGRKLFTMSALLDKAGTAYAVAEDISIVVDINRA